MLTLKNVVKEYVTGDTKVTALKGIDLSFRKSEFVSVLGPSGCGKTTLLNIVGGLDRYTEGDLLISGKSTKQFKAYDWDAYRNSCVGFVFQSYNLIPHQTVAGNVELALTLSGVSKSERRRKAIEALKKVGLGEQINKRPNQLSGGQMQRVAIARAIVNDPEIILADEPTGALDSKTSVQIMDILKEISRDRLIVMVTHNDELAKTYSTRIVKLMDGEVVGDTNPYTPEQEEADERNAETEKEDKSKSSVSQAEHGKLTEKQIAKLIKKQKKAEEKEKKAQLRKTSMAYTTACALSFKNLSTKKGRTFMTAFAGSIGIIGIALVLSISNGFKIYIDDMQSGTLAGFPVTVSQITVDMQSTAQQIGGHGSVNLPEYPDSDKLNVYTPQSGMEMHYNNIDDAYLEYIKGIDRGLYNEISYSYTVEKNVLAKNGDKVSPIVTSSGSAMSSLIGTSDGNFQEMLTNSSFMNSHYDVIAGAYPKNGVYTGTDGSLTSDLVLVVDKYNRLSTAVMKDLGLTVGDANNATLSEMVGKEFKLVLNDEWFTYNAVAKKVFLPYSFFASQPSPEKTYEQLYENKKLVTLKISGVMRVKESAPLSLYNTGLLYTHGLSEFLVEDGIQSQIGQKQLYADDALTHDYLTGQTFEEDLEQFEQSGMLKYEMNASQFRDQVIQGIGATKRPTNVYIYPKDFGSKAKITKYLDKYNVGKSDAEKILYMDASSVLSDTMGNMIDIITYALVAFAAVSLVVSSIMIGIITYVSVIERTKEIGVLRSIGARKKDISRVFNAETLLIGLTAGLIGVLIAFILTFPLSAIIKGISAGMVKTNMAVLDPVAALVLVVISMALTLISGLIPAHMAAKKDPVVALRSGD